MKRVSVGLPVYNCEQYIAEALRALINQTFEEIEIIVSDNCSTDKTAEICEEFCKKDTRIKYIRQEKNIGVVKNFQYVLDASESEYFMWTAADDKIDLNYIETLYRSFTPLDLALISNVVLIDDAGITKKTVIPVSYKLNEHFRFLVASHHSYQCMHMYGLFRKSYLMKLDFGIFDAIDYWPDYVYMLSGLSIGNLRCVQGTNIYYRLHGNNTSKSLGLKHYNIRRLLWGAFPMVFLKGCLKASASRGRTVIIFALLIKYIREQLRIYFSAIGALIFDTKYFLARLKSKR